MVGCRVVVPYHRTAVGQQLVLVGSCESLGNWDPNKGAKLTWCEGHSHVADLELPAHSPVSCKLVVLSERGGAVWEPDADRELLLAPATLVARAAGFTVLAHWGFPDCTQVLPNALRRGASPSQSRSGARSSPGSSGRSGRKSSPSTTAGGSKGGHGSGRNGNGSGGGSLLEGMRKILAQASSLEGQTMLPIVESREAVSGHEEVEDEEDGEVGLVECQVTVLLPKGAPRPSAGQSLVLVGSGPALGCWEPADGLPLERAAHAGDAGDAGGDGAGGEGGAMWTARAELPLGAGLQAKVVVVDCLSGAAQEWEPCENRCLPSAHGGDRPVLITAYWGEAQTHGLEVDRLGGGAAAASSSSQVVTTLRQQLAATATQLDDMRRERDEARRARAAGEEQMRALHSEAEAVLGKGYGRSEMVQLAEQLQTTRQLYEATKREAEELGGAVGVTRKLHDAAKRELRALAAQLDAARAAYEALAPAVDRMEDRLTSTSRAVEAARPELAALEAQLERARSTFDRALSQLEAARALAAAGAEGHQQHRQQQQGQQKLPQQQQQQRRRAGVRALEAQLTRR